MGSVNKYTIKMLERKTIKCLDGKERVFDIMENGNVDYRGYKNGDWHGRTFCTDIDHLPKFITKEMLGL